MRIFSSYKTQGVDDIGDNAMPMIVNSKNRDMYYHLKRRADVENRFVEAVRE